MHPADEFLMHYGVKGMKWGKRAKAPQAAGYTDRQRANDKLWVGKRAPQNVDKHVAKGKTLEEARRIEKGKSARRAKIAVSAGILATLYAPQILRGTEVALNLTEGLGRHALYSAMNAQNTRKGAKFAANMFADSRGIGNQETVRLSFDQASKVWR